jgi:hypothetical protein
VPLAADMETLAESLAAAQMQHVSALSENRRLQGEVNQLRGSHALLQSRLQERERESNALLENMRVRSAGDDDSSALAASTAAWQGKALRLSARLKRCKVHSYLRFAVCDTCRTLALLASLHCPSLSFFSRLVIHVFFAPRHSCCQAERDRLMELSNTLRSRLNAGALLPHACFEVISRARNSQRWTRSQLLAETSRIHALWPNGECFGGDVDVFCCSFSFPSSSPIYQALIAPLQKRAGREGCCI